MSFFLATNAKSTQLLFPLMLLSLMLLVTPAFAQQPTFSENAPGQMSNPFPFNLSETFSTPAFADMDNDGDLDMLSGDETGNVLYFENSGSGFIQQTGTDNPFDGLTSMSGKTAPGIVDYNGDGLYDVFVGDEDGTFTYYENNGTAEAPSFALGTNPLMGIDIGNRTNAVFADLDGDGDKDMVSGEFNGALFYFQNTGSGLTQLSGASNPFNAIDAGTLSKPALGDLNNDGLYDLVVGNEDGILIYYENTGTTMAPAFTLISGTNSPLDGFDALDESAPAIADVTPGDGSDVIVGNTQVTITTTSTQIHYLLS